MRINESQTTLFDLPGGSVIEQLIQERIDRGEQIAVLFIGLVNFETYCQKYGWRKGAHLVELLAQSIQQSLASVDHPRNVLGHILGDEFIALTPPQHAEQLAQEMISRFDARVPEYYNEEDRQQGFFDTVDRRGNPVRAHLASLAIAIVTNAYRTWEHPFQVENIAAEIRNYIKMVPGSRYAFDRRQK